MPSCLFFSRFPSNKDVQEKWKTSLGVTETKSHHGVCVQHFHEDNYKIEGGKRAKLYKGAVPSMKVSKERYHDLP